MEGFIAQIIMFAGTFPPRNWAFCQGQTISIAQNTALFSIVGTTYGGNGQTTFGLPDFRGRMPVGVGQGPGLANVSWGEKAGTETVTLTTNTMPAHTHAVTPRVNISDANATSTEADGSILATPVSNLYTADTNASGNLGGVSAGLNSTTGGGQPFNIMSPYTAMNFVICLYGFFPARN